MNRKIESAKKKRELRAEQERLYKENITVSQKLIASTERLYKLVNGKEDYDFTKLEKQLAEIDKHLDLSQYFQNLERSIEQNSPLTSTQKTKIQDFSKLLEAVKNNKPIETKIDLKKLEKAVVNIEQYIRENTEKSDQGAEKYQPVRRVVKVGNRFIFDDNFTNAGGGGGSSGGGTTDGLTDAQLRASPVPVSASIDTTGLATSAKQDTQTALLTTIDTDTGNIATEVAGLLTDTELRATPVPVSGTVTATPTGTQNVDVTANTIGLATGTKQDTGNTSLASIKTNTDKIPSQGQALEAASTPVVLPASQITTLTPPAAITGFATSANQTTIIGHVDGIEASVDGIETLIGTTNSTLTTIDGRVDGLETLVTSTNTKLDTANTSLGTLDNAISGNEMQVDVVASLPAGTNNIGDVDVLSLPALPAGTNAIGKLSANSGVDIGDVDVTSTTFPTPVATSTYSPTRFVDFGSNATANIKSSAGNVFSLYCNNENSSDRYIQLHNTATTPAGGTTPLYSFRVPGSGDILVGTDFFTNAGANFTTGIAFAFSTTKDTYTAGTATEQSTTVHYK